MSARVTDEDEPENFLEAQRVLGNAMQVLHDNAFVTQDNPALHEGLAGEFERIKITLLPTTLDELSKFWTAMPEANFRCSVAYVVSVVQIESQRPRRYPRLVGEPPPAGPIIYAVPIRTPRISEVRVIRFDDIDMQERRYPYARIAELGGDAQGDTLVLRGTDFAGENTRVTLDTLDITASIGGERIVFEIPDDPAIQPGTHTLRVIQDIEIAGRPSPLAGFQSNIAFFVLAPWINTVTNVGDEIIISGQRLYHDEHQCLTIIGDHVIQEYTMETPTEIRFARPPELTAGEYVVRVRVNGVESLPEESITLP